MQAPTASHFPNEAILAVIGGGFLGASWMLLAVLLLTGPVSPIPRSTELAILLSIGAACCFSALHRRYAARRPRPERPRKPVLGI